MSALVSACLGARCPRCRAALPWWLTSLTGGPVRLVPLVSCASCNAKVRIAGSGARKVILFVVLFMPLFFVGSAMLFKLFGALGPLLIAAVSSAIIPYRLFGLEVLP